MTRPHRIRTLVTLLALILSMIVTASGYAQHGIPIPCEGRDIGFVEIAGITNAERNSRVRPDPRALLPDFPTELEPAMRARGNPGSSTHRLFWAGSTH